MNPKPLFFIVCPKGQNPFQIAVTEAKLFVFKKELEEYLNIKASKGESFSVYALLDDGGAVPVSFRTAIIL